MLKAIDLNNKELKFFVVSDVHAHFTHLKKTLDTAGFEADNPNHILVSCGDFFDRGSEPLECLRFLNALSDNRKILVRGNHDGILAYILTTKEYDETDVDNGTVQTIVDIYCAAENNREKHTVTRLNDELALEAIRDFDQIEEYKKYIDSLEPGYYAELGNVILTHSSLPFEFDPEEIIRHPKHIHAKANLRGASEDEWFDAIWADPYVQGIDYGVLVPDKKMIVGHYATIEGRSRHAQFEHDDISKPTKGITSFIVSDPNDFVTQFAPDQCGVFHYVQGEFDGENTSGAGAELYAIDACTAWTRYMNCLVLDYDAVFTHT